MTATKSRAAGLSLVELLIVIVIIGILVTIAYPRIRAARGDRGGRAARLEWVALPDSSAPAGSAARVAVRAEDASGYPVRGVVLELEGDAGTGQVMRDSATTDRDGVARVSWRFAGDTTGAQRRLLVSARVRGRPEVSVRATTPLPGAGRRGGESPTR